MRLYKVKKITSVQQSWHVLDDDKSTKTYQTYWALSTSHFSTTFTQQNFHSNKQLLSYIQDATQVRRQRTLWRNKYEPHIQCVQWFFSGAMATRASRWPVSSTYCQG